MKIMKLLPLCCVLLIGCGANDEKHQVEVTQLKQEISKLKAELALRTKPESDALDEMQQRLKNSWAANVETVNKLNAKIAEQERQITALSKNQTPEIAPLNTLLSVMNHNILDLREDVNDLQKRVKGTEDSISSHKFLHE